MRIKVIAAFLISLYPALGHASFNVQQSTRTEVNGSSVAVEDDDLLSEATAKQRETDRAVVEAVRNMRAVEEPQSAQLFDCMKVPEVKLGPGRLAFNIVPTGPTEERDKDRLKIAKTNPDALFIPHGIAQYGPKTVVKIGTALCKAGAGMLLLASELQLSADWITGIKVEVSNEPMYSNAALVWPPLEAKSWNSIKLLPPRKIQIDTGFLIGKYSDEQIAGVFAHELAHGLLEHARTKQLAIAGGDTLLSPAVGIGAGVAVAKLAKKTGLGVVAGLAAGLASAVTVYCKSVELSLISEQEADILGVKAISKVTGNLAGAKHIWQTYLKQSMSAKDENENCFESDNPHPSQRIRMNAVEFLEVQPVH